MATVTRRIKITHSASRVVVPSSSSNSAAGGDAEPANSEGPGSGPSEAEEVIEETVTDVDATESVSGSDGDVPAEFSRGRGRPRGRPRGSRAGPGRPRGRGRGRGRGRASVILRLPGFGGGDGDGEESQAGEVGEDGEVMGGGKPFRKVGGQVYVFENDELVTEDDPKGDQKIDKDGVLQGGRQFKAQTFVLPHRHPTRQYMLAIEAARTSGYKDSLYYFRRNPVMHKLVCTQVEKDELIAAGTIPSHMRTRSVTLVTARSAYKQHGAKMLRDGKWVEDDYYEDKVLADILLKGLKPGDPVGELTDLLSYASTKDPVAAQSQPSRGDGTSRGGGITLYKPGGPTTFFGGNGLGPFDGDLSMIKKMAIQRDGVDRENWMWTAASKVQEWNEEWTRARKERMKVCGGVLATDSNGTEIDGPEKKRRKVGNDLPLGVYEPHTGIVHYREDTQPTRSRWEPMNHKKVKEVLGGTRVGAGAWGLARVDTMIELQSEEEERKYEETRRTVSDVERS